tara:strand:- start:501 stop:851 length:351 start_codon:yes stop_codon:yes gene_type:complete
MKNAFDKSISGDNSASVERQPTVPAVHINTKRHQDKHTSAPQKAPRKLRSKSETILQALKRKRGASLDELCTITGWQAHSLRGHISGTLRKKNKLNIVSDCTKSGIRRYRLIEECV